MSERDYVADLTTGSPFSKLADTNWAKTFNGLSQQITGQDSFIGVLQIFTGVAFGFKSIGNLISGNWKGAAGYGAGAFAAMGLNWDGLINGTDDSLVATGPDTGCAVCAQREPHQCWEDGVPVPQRIPPGIPTPAPTIPITADA